MSPAELRIFLYLSQAKGRGLINLLGAAGGQIKYSYEVRNSNRRVATSLKNNQVSFAIDLWLEGNIVENPEQTNLDDESVLKELEQRLSAQLERECQRVIRKIQGELATDILNLGEYVRAYHPHYWQKVDWQKEFPTVPITVRHHHVPPGPPAQVRTDRWAAPAAAKFATAAGSACLISL